MPITQILNRVRDLTNFNRHVAKSGVLTHKVSILIDPSLTSDTFKVEPECLHIKPGEQIQVVLEGTNKSPQPFISLEFHLPGNKHRKMMYMSKWRFIPRSLVRTDTVYFDRTGGFIQIGKGAMRGRHRYCVYAHFKGSVVTRPSTGRPTMIVE